MGEKLWIKIQEKQGKGGAIWVKSTNNEQRFQLSKSGSTNWNLSNFDGLQLITHPNRKNANGKMRVRSKEIIKKETSSKNEEINHPKIMWDMENTPRNFITRTALFKYEVSQFKSEYKGTSAYGEYPPKRLWEEPWIDDLELITKSLLSHLCDNCKLYKTLLNESRIACLDIETTDFIPKAYEGFVNIIGISRIDLHNFTSRRASVLLFQAFNMTRKRKDAPKLLELAHPYLKDIDTLVVFNKNFDIKILSTLIKESGLNIVSVSYTHLTLPTILLV